MAYFSNGTEGQVYQESYCLKCEHRPEDENEGDCPIWTAHLFYAYGAKGDVKDILNMLIPEVDHTFTDGLTYKVAGECRFFTRKQLQFAEFFD